MWATRKENMFHNQPDSKHCPEHLKQGIIRYVVQGVPTGDFLRCCLQNDLKGAVGHADLESLRCLIHVVAFLHNKVPSMCWGSPAAVKAWLAGNPISRLAFAERFFPEEVDAERKLPAGNKVPEVQQ